MSVIIRLQNLPWSANAMDIRTYFRGLSIPEGGVHIVGGEMGDAFIAFSTDEDARQAMMSDGGKIKDVPVKLLLSSRAEMQKIIEVARQQAMAFMGIPPQPPIISSLLAQSIQQAELNNRSAENETKEDNSRNDDTNRDESNRKSGKDRDRSSRSRSRDRRRERSRSRERRDRRRRERSRSRDRKTGRRRDSRRDRSRDNSRERTRERDSRRSRDSKRDDNEKSKSKSGSPVNKKTGVPQVWDNTNMGNNDLNRSNSIGSSNILNGHQLMPLMGNNGFKPWATAPILNFNAEQLSRLQTLEGRRNPTAFQNTSNSTLFNQENPLMLNSGRGTCIHMINLDQTTSYNEIRAIFAKLQIAQNGIKIVTDKRSCKRTAYVRFTRLDHKIQALACNGQNIRGKLVEVRTIDDQQFEEAEDTCRPPAPVISNSIEIDSDTDNEQHVVNDSNTTFGYKNPNINDNQNQAFTVLKLDGIPPFAKEHHIIKMFSDYSVMNIHIIEGAGTMSPKDTRKHHLAYVEFHRPADAACALNDDNRHVIGPKKIIVTSCTKREMQEAKDRNGITSDIHLSGKELNDKQNALLKDPRQRRFDDLNPKFLLSNDMMSKTAPDLGNAMLPVSNQMDFNRPPSMRQNMESINGVQDRIDTDWVVLANLPTKISDRDIMDFFSDVGLVPCRLHLLPGNQTVAGQQAVDGVRCFCRFEGGPDSVRRACTKDGMPLGMSRISVTPVMQSIVEEATGSKEAPPSVFSKPPPSFQQQQILLQQQTQQSLSNQSQGQQQQQHQFAPPLMNLNITQPIGGGPPSLLGPGPLPMMRGDGMMNMRRPPPLFAGRGGRGRGNFPIRGRGGLFSGNFPRNQAPPSQQPADIAAVDGFGAPGCVISMENVPFRAGVEEILEFFRGFDIPRENVIRRFNEQGNPTGDAKVAFSNPQDAQRAMESRLSRGLNCKIRDRRIYMTIT